MNGGGRAVRIERHQRSTRSDWLGSSIAVTAQRLWFAVLALAAVSVGCTAIAPPGPQASMPTIGSSSRPEPVIEPDLPPSPPVVMRADLAAHQRVMRADGSEFTMRYSSAVFDPRWLDLQFSAGWEHEEQANADTEALLFFTGPTYERQPGRHELGIALHGDLLLGNGEWRAGNNAAAAQRAYLAITSAGELEFGYGRLLPEQRHHYRIFIGGLHALINTTQAAPETYKGVYSRLSLADVRIIYAGRADGQLELIETADGLHVDDLRAFAAQQGYVAVYLPDHASKSRFIVPGIKLWSEQQALWVSGGDLSITPLPFMLKAQPTSAWFSAPP